MSLRADPLLTLYCQPLFRLVVRLGGFAWQEGLGGWKILGQDLYWTLLGPVKGGTGGATPSLPLVESP